jgi:CubicO group peptidase (beta-lactamase class C family)
VRGNGDGGAYTTAADCHALWDAFFAGRIVAPETVAEMVRPRSHVPEDSMGYGLGFWLYDSSGAVSMHGFDTGACFVSARVPDGRFTYTVLCNKGSGAWRVSQRLAELLASSTSTVP